MEGHETLPIPGRPRYAPQRLLPPYSYVPGHAPHPVSHPDGHMYGESMDEEVTPLNPQQWRECGDYLYGIDLFNHGFYWEAHEAWEGTWHAAGRTGRVADFLKALIKLAAAAVKLREGVSQGALRHVRRARELLASAYGARESDYRFAGLLVEPLQQAADVLQNEAEQVRCPQPLAVYAVVLEPT